jgi:hypothetical protein
MGRDCEPPSPTGSSIVRTATIAPQWFILPIKADINSDIGFAPATFSIRTPMFFKNF